MRKSKWIYCCFILLVLLNMDVYANSELWTKWTAGESDDALRGVDEKDSYYVASGKNMEFIVSMDEDYKFDDNGNAIADVKIGSIDVILDTSSDINCTVSNLNDEYELTSGNVFVLKGNSSIYDPFKEEIAKIVCTMPTSQTVLNVSDNRYINIKTQTMERTLATGNSEMFIKEYRLKIGILNKDYLNSLSTDFSIESISFDNQELASGSSYETSNASVKLKVNKKSNLNNKLYLYVESQLEGKKIDEELTTIEKTIDLTYGMNAISIGEASEKYNFIDSLGKVSYYGFAFEDIMNISGVKQNIYTINRLDTRSKVNTLKSLSISDIAINFNSDLKTYIATVPYKVSSIKINSILTDIKSSYVPGYGNRVVNLNEGNNDVLVKVKAENGDEAVYTIKITREQNNDASLRTINVNDKKIMIKKDVLKYSVKVDNEVINPIIEIIPNDSKAKYEMTEIKELIEGSNVVEITVSASNGNKLVYVLDIIRDTLISTNSKLKDIVIKNHKLDFISDKEAYDVMINHDEEQLEIEVIPENNKAKYVVVGNKNLKNGSQIKIKVTAEDEVTISNYTINIIKAKAPLNIWLIIIPVVIVLGCSSLFVLKKIRGKKSITKNEKDKIENKS